ncbi:phage tail domain-containing protein [Paenibacillus fonticola]|uniref:phage tail domain-containing protein n=1 Tax=Paenibacillus fonticola TaxID=379896 RepID=UPI0003778BFD|nr:phage tail domain-containing protein [Paenibacillus fonticola]
MFKITIRNSLYFSYAGRVSAEFGILNVSLSGGMAEEPLASSREIYEVSVKGRDQPYFQGMEKDPLRFNVSFAFKNNWDSQKLREVTRWLTEHDYYQELFFTNDIGRDPERIYYALVVDDPTLVHNSLSQGYINLTFRCDSPYAYSPTRTSQLYKWEKNSHTNTISNFSQGDKKSMITGTDGGLILNPHRTKWSDFSYDMKWTELDQLLT